MCWNCWDDVGQPAANSPDIRRAVTLISEIYETEPTGCPLHVELDDWNVEGQWAPWGTPADLADPAKWDVAVELAELMNRMPVEDRLSALARHDGMVEPYPGCWALRYPRTGE